MCVWMGGCYGDGCVWGFRAILRGRAREDDVCEDVMMCECVGIVGEVWCVVNVG